jgi:KUP system potassium uptake protein
VRSKLHRHELKAERLVSSIRSSKSSLHVLEGDLVFLTDDAAVAPLALRAMVDDAGVIPSRAVLLSWDVQDSPAAADEETQVEVRTYGDTVCDVVGVSVVLGYRERLDVHHILGQAVKREPDLLGDLDPRAAGYVISVPVLQASKRSPLGVWRRRLFLGMNRLSRDTVDQLALPRGRTVVIGREVEI